MNYIETAIYVRDQQLRERFIAELSQIGYYGFEEGEDLLKAFITENDFDENQLKSILADHEIVYRIDTIPEQNWNELWESNFEPITVEDFVGVRAAFHEPIDAVKHEIIITPKMSFGTGHHATTWMMMKLMQEVEFANKNVFDFGTGTGILAILAEKLGAAQVLAVDHDDWCISNAEENFTMNDCNRIILQKADSADVKQKFDVILANINRNVIEENLSYFDQNLGENGVILLSGLLQSDEPALQQQLATYKIFCMNSLQKNSWIAFKCRR